jgi:hypothetical protein
VRSPNLRALIARARRHHVSMEMHVARWRQSGHTRADCHESACAARDRRDDTLLTIRELHSREVALATPLWADGRPHRPDDDAAPTTARG